MAQIKRMNHDFGFVFGAYHTGGCLKISFGARRNMQACCALGGEGQRAGEADALGCASDQNGLSLQLQIHNSFSRVSIAIDVAVL